MAILKPSHKEQAAKHRRRRLAENKTGKGKRFDRRRLFATAGFVAFTGILVGVCFFRLTPPEQNLVAGDVARFRVVSDFSFSFRSDVLTREKIDKRLIQVPPHFRIDATAHERFAKYFRGLVDTIVATLPTDDLEQIEELNAILSRILVEYDPENRYGIAIADLSAVIGAVAPGERDARIDDALDLLRRFSEAGLVREDENRFLASPDSVGIYQVNRESTDESDPDITLQSVRDAKRALRLKVITSGANPAFSNALARIVVNGLEPNLKLDDEKTRLARKRAREDVDPVLVAVDAGQVLVEPGMIVTERTVEELQAYREAVKGQQRNFHGFTATFWERTLLTVAILASAIIYVRVGARSQKLRQDRRMALTASALLLNMISVRVLIELAGAPFVAEESQVLYSIGPFISPIALGPMLTAIIISSSAGVLVALLTALLAALMHGGSIPLLIIWFLASLVGIYHCHNVQGRSRVVTAGLLVGVTMAICAFFLGIRDGLSNMEISVQVLSSIAAGFATGIAVVGLIPMFEKIFRYTTEITLLELTDYNHPLLRRMQMNAPGSYHHSLMVANLSERAAVEIGANPLICRVCSLFHDIGKLVKPEYFTENQMGAPNPHIRQNPSMSALIIKAHVKEGVFMAREFKLPQIIIDVIQQHHGTSLIQYFYYLALKKQKEKRETTPPMQGAHAAPEIDLDQVDESTYRYEGPKPQFKESAIIFLADSIEAASRSLAKVTKPAVDELIDAIVKSRIEDHQLSDCPITFEELTHLKKSFSFTLLNSLHSRVAYPSDKKDDKKAEGGKPTVGETKGASEKPGSAEGGIDTEAKPKAAKPEPQDKESADSSQSS